MTASLYPSSENSDQSSIEYFYDRESFPTSQSIKKRRNFFKKLPYTNFPFSKRNWGHSLHTLCSYQSRLKASIAYYLVQCFSRPGDKILDPFSGVGTIPFEACLNGRQGFGLDINPVAYHTALSKVQFPKKEDVMKYLNEMNLYVKCNVSGQPNVDDYTKRFYHPKTLNEILLAREFFIKHQEITNDSAFSLLLSCMLHILHGNRPYALSRRSHNLTPLKPTGPFVYKSIYESLLNKINLSFKNKMTTRYLPGGIKIGSVLKIPYRKEFFDSILTSPPFWSSTRFYANNRIRLWFCGWDYHTQERLGRSEFFEELQKKSISIYYDVFNEFSKVLKPDGLCVLHLGVVPNLDIGKEILPLAKKTDLKPLDLIYENTEGVERHGMTDQGVTKSHEFLILQKTI